MESQTTQRQYGRPGMTTSAGKIGLMIGLFGAVTIAGLALADDPNLREMPDRTSLAGNVTSMPDCPGCVKNAHDRLGYSDRLVPDTAATPSGTSNDRDTVR